MAWLAEWRGQRAHRQRAEQYVRSLPAQPEAAELAWATGLCGEASRARRELGWLRWAVSRLVAERDAMDDRTAAAVVRVMEPLASAEADAAPGDAEGWAERWAQYAAAAGERGTATRLPDRLAAVLLRAVGHPVAPSPVAGLSAESFARARVVVERYRTESNAALREAFGTVSLPEHVRPSTLRA